jgi:hypothetical protein
LRGPPEAAKAGGVDDFLYWFLACLSAQTHPHFLRSRATCAQQRRERIVDTPHGIQIVLKVIIRERLDDHPGTVVAQDSADVRSGADWVSHVVEAVEDRHEVKLFTWELPAFRHLERDPVRHTLTLGGFPRRIHGLVMVRLACARRRGERRFSVIVSVRSPA